MTALVNAAAESLARDGIACTSQFEQTLLADANGLCLEIVSALLAEGAETYTRYEPVSADTMREIVRPREDALKDFAKAPPGEVPPVREEEIACVMADGMGVPLRRECLSESKGKNGRARTREIKAAAMFTASRT